MGETLDSDVTSPPQPSRGFAAPVTITPAPNSTRRRAAATIVVTVLAIIAGLIFIAVVADGREVSQASSNDGGAWLVNRELGVIGHRNRSAGELSAFMRVADSPSAEIHQAARVVVVHDEATQLLHEVDARTFSEDLEPTRLPEAAQVTAVDGAVVVVQPDPLRVWRIAVESLSATASLEDVEPTFSLDGPGVAAVAADGRIALADVAGTRLNWLTADGAVDAVTLPGTSPVRSITIVDASAVLLRANGDIEVAGSVNIEHTIVWGSVATSNQPQLSVLQQPSSAVRSGGLRPAERIAGVTEAGDVLEVVLVADTQIVTRANLAGTTPLAPIAHQGCIYAVVTEPALLGSVCDQVTTRRLDGAGADLRLRLVNGWVWVNDLQDGGTWVTNQNQQVELLDDWSLAARALQDENEEDDSGATTGNAMQRTLVEDPDAQGSVQDSDEFDPSEPNTPPVAVNDLARTRVDRAAIVPVLANDTDANNDILVVTQFALLSGDAQVDITPARDSIQVSPAPGFVGLVEVEYWVSDGRSAPVSAFATIEVAPLDAVNNPPVVQTDVVATAPGHATTIDVLLNDLDPDGDALALVSIESETGTLRWSPDGQVTFTPDSTTAAGWVELQYVVVDDLGAESTGVLRVEIRDLGANQEPDARNDQATTIVGRPVVIDLLANDSDPDGDVLLVGSRPQLLEPQDGDVRMSTTSDGEFVFTAEVAGTYLLSYSVTDSAIGGSESDTAQIRVDVLPVAQNTPPVAVRDDIVITAGASRVVYVLENDGDADGDVVGIVDWQSTPGLRITEFDDGSGHVGFRVFAAPDAPARSRFLYSISDGRSDPVSAPVVVAVVNQVPFDQPPIANDDVFEARAGSTLVGVEVLANDFDPEGGSLRIVSVTSPDTAAVSVASDGQTLNITIPAGLTSSFTFSYDIEDEAENRAAAVVRVQLVAEESVNRPPTARTDDARTVQGIPIDIDVLANDSDPDGDVIALEGVTAQPENGSAIVIANGLVRYQPDPTFTGTDLIRYSIVDSQGDRAVGEIFIGVVPREEFNSAPVANDDSYALNGGPVVTPLDVLENDFDPDGDPIRVIDLTRASHGSVAVDEFGSVQFSPPESLPEPTTVTFGYTIADNAGNRADAAVAITLPAYELELATPTPVPATEPTPTPTPQAEPTPAVPTPEPTAEPTVPPEVNEPPVALDDQVGPVRARTRVVVDVLGNDFDPDGPRSELRVVSVGEQGSLQGDAVAIEVGTVAVQVPYTIADAAGAEASAFITVVVSANRPPEVAPLEVDAAFETPLPLGLAGQATDADDDELFFICCDNIRGGSISAVTAVAGVLDLTFTPAPGFSGQGGFAYTVDDQQGNQVAGSVTVQVAAPDNRSPVAVGNTVDVPQGATVAVDLAGLASDPDGDDVTWAIAQPPGLGIVAELTSSVVLITADRDVSVSDQTSFDYEISDGVLSAEASINLVVVSGANEPPVARDASVEVAAASSATVDLAALSQDSDIGEVLTWSLSNVAPVGGLTVDLVGSTMQVRAEPDASGATASIEYTVTDRQGATATGRIDVLVIDPTAPPPTAVDDQAATQQGATITIDVVANDIDPLGEGLTVVAASSDQGTAVPVAGGVRFSVGDFTGSALVQYTVRDVASRESSAQVVVETVGPPEQPAPPSVTAGSTQVTISWSTPQERGAEISGYRIGSSTGETQDVGIQNSLTWTGLTNGDTYAFTVTAISSVGLSDESEPSLSVVPNQVPETPSSPTVTFGDGKLQVSWAEPANNGTAIIGYELEIGGSVSEPPVPVGTATSYEWRGLENGQEFTFRVRAENAAGFGPFSAASASEHPEAPPGPPIIGTAGRGNLSGSLTVNWSPPVTDNGGAIINYRVVPSIGSPVVVGTSAGFHDWSNLTNGVEMTFRVQARNRAGWGDLSAASSPVVPCGKPGRPALNAPIRGDRQVALSLSEPDDNGCGITGYIFTSNTGTVQPGSSTNHTFDGLANGTAYTFTVVATNEMGASDPSPGSDEVVPAGPPLCPSGGIVAAVATAPGEIQLNWPAAIDNGDPLVQYRITYDSASVDIAPTPGTTIGSLNNATSYTFAIRAVNAVGTSPICGSVSETTWAAPTPLNVSLAFDADLDELTATASGGASPSNPITTWAATITHANGTVEDQTWSGSGSPPNSFGFGVTEDGIYQFDMSVCNAVGCATVDRCCDVQVTLTGPPDQMDAPTMSWDWPAWDRFGVDVSATFTPPNDNGASITVYVWERRYRGASGVWHDDAGTNGLNTDFTVAFWPGYSTYYDGSNQGQTVTWEVRVAAVNSEGTGVWSEWGSVTPDLRDPHVVLSETGFISGCLNEPELQLFLDCSELFLEVHGVAANRTYSVDVRLADGSPAPLDPGDCSGASFTTDQGGNYGGVLNCVFLLTGPMTLVADVDGVLSPPALFGGSS